eukprot:gene20294-22280_t
MRLKELESYLQQLDTFEEPKVNLEQYATTPHIASHMLYNINNCYNDLKGKVVADFGCGCGILSIGAAMFDAFVIAIDIDFDAIEVAARNKDDFEIENVEFIQSDLTTSALPFCNNNIVNTVIMNPPFGTKNNKGIDMKFLQTAISTATESVYSLHKTSTREHVLKKAKEWNTIPTVLAELRYDLPKTYKFHRRQSLDIAVDFIRFDVGHA